MASGPLSNPKFVPEELPPDLRVVLQRHLLAGFQPDLALDLTLNELVVRAAAATGAHAAALALNRGKEMVCCAATGRLAPDLGVPVNTHDGLSAACLRTRQPQLSVDSEYDPRIDPSISSRIGIRSILIVPVMEDQQCFAGILEVFSATPAAFTHEDQELLEGFAAACVSLRRIALGVGAPHLPSNRLADVFHKLYAARPGFVRTRPDAATLAMSAVVVLATVLLGGLVAVRTGWLTPTLPSEVRPAPPQVAEAIAPRRSVSEPAIGYGLRKGTSSYRANPAASGAAAVGGKPRSSDELVVYDKGKVVFRMKVAPGDRDSASQVRAGLVDASSRKRLARWVWLSPAKAGARLLTRTEPQYPAEALAAHRTGNVVLEVQVGEDGAVSNVRPLSGDPVLVAAAADAVRNWRYQPFRQNDRTLQFQTDVTLSFSLPSQEQF